jgi:hypothetical protein
MIEQNQDGCKEKEAALLRYQGDDEGVIQSRDLSGNPHPLEAYTLKTWMQRERGRSGRINRMVNQEFFFRLEGYELGANWFARLHLSGQACRALARALALLEEQEGSLPDELHLAMSHLRDCGRVGPEALEEFSEAGVRPLYTKETVAV